jgi:putative FmdB family regulatory protein
MLAEYQCRDCQHVFERLEYSSDDNTEPPFCPLCGAQAEIIPSVPAPPVFKGAAWNS